MPGDADRLASNDDEAYDRERGKWEEREELRPYLRYSDDEREAPSYVRYVNSHLS